MRVLVAGWIGSTNLGDELALAGLRRLLAPSVASVAAISVAPDATRATHGVGAVSHAAPYDLLRATRRADAVVFGGGGIVQDVTSPLNLPYHLSRVRLARWCGTPVAGIGLGIGGLDTAVGRAMVRRELAGLAGISVRDLASARLLEEVGVPGARVASDLAFALDPPEVHPVSGPDRLVVSLRPWSERRSRRPVAAREDPTPVGQVRALADALDRTARRTGLEVRFVALQTDRDDVFHRRVAERMRTAVTFAAPPLEGLLHEYAAATAALTMRYHGGVAATLAGVPMVLLSYALKTDALAEELGPGARRLGLAPRELASIPEALEGVTTRRDDVLAARERLTARQEGNQAVLDQLLATAGRG